MGRSDELRNSVPVSSRDDDDQSCWSWKGPLCDGRRWHILQTEPQREMTAAHYLADHRRFRVYVPTERKYGRSGVKNVITDKVVPIFRGYLFIALNRDLDDSRWHLIYRAQGLRGGIHTFLTINERPAIVGDEAMGLVADGEQVLMAKRDFRSNEQYRQHIGKEVRIVEGPFAGFWALLARLEGRNRIGLLLDFGGRRVPIHVDASAIQLPE